MLLLYHIFKSALNIESPLKLWVYCGVPRSANNTHLFVVQLLNHLRLFATPWSAACQASLSFTISRSLLKLMSVKSVMPSNHLILCCPLLLHSVYPSIRGFSKESAFCIRWPFPASPHGQSKSGKDDRLAQQKIDADGVTPALAFHLVTVVALSAGRA